MFSDVTPRAEGWGRRRDGSVGGSLCSAVGPITTRLKPVLPAVCDQFPRCRRHRLTNVAVNSLVRRIRKSCASCARLSLTARFTRILIGRPIDDLPRQRTNERYRPDNSNNLLMTFCTTRLFLPTLDIVVVAR